MAVYITSLPVAHFDTTPDVESYFGHFPRRHHHHHPMMPSFESELARLAAAQPTRSHHPCMRRRQPACRVRLAPKTEEQQTLSIPTNGFKPEEITMEVDKETRMLTVKGCSEKKNSEGIVIAKREFEKSFKLPSDCDVEAIAAKHNQENILRVDMPSVSKKSIERASEEKTEPESTMTKETPALNGDGPILEEKSEEEIKTAEPMEDEEEPEDSLFDAKVTTDNNFTISINVGVATSPEELSLEMSPKTRQLNVKAKENMRSFIIPEKFDLEKMSSALAKDSGILTITAPVKKVEDVNTSIPIKMA